MGDTDGPDEVGATDGPCEGRGEGRLVAGLRVGATVGGSGLADAPQGHSGRKDGSRAHATRSARPALNAAWSAAHIRVLKHPASVGCDAVHHACGCTAAVHCARNSGLSAPPNAASPPCIGTHRVTDTTAGASDGKSDGNSVGYRDGGLVGVSVGNRVGNLVGNIVVG